MKSQTTSIFDKARGVNDPEERRAYVEEICGEDEALREEVESLLDAFERAGSFLQNPVKGVPLQGMTEHTFGDYELLEEVARGGMGVVYKARQLSLNRLVAVKMILAGHLASDDQVKRFRLEAQAAAGLNHPNIVGIYEVGEHNRQHYYTMPLLVGQNLAQLVESGRWRPDNGTKAAEVMRKVALAVQCAHEAGILHRDIKPGNIVIDAEDEPHVTDFGLAKRIKGEPHLTVTGHVLGTPSFMAPEQARGRSDQSSRATDIYSLGAVLYYLLTGRPPFMADSPLDALLLVLEAEAVLPRRINPLVPGPLEHICLRCLKKRPEDRYASAGDLTADLDRFLKGEPLTVNPEAIGRRFEAWSKRKPALVARLGTVALCTGIVETAYQIKHYTTGPRHYAVIGVLLFWLIVSFVCQRGVENPRYARWIRFVWSAADPIALTAILFIAQAFKSPLVILYPTLVAASGFWLRASLVLTTTVFSLLGYVLLLLNAGALRDEKVHAHWHLLAFVAIIVTGLTVAYLVNRVSALTRFHERQPPAKG